VVLNRNWNFKYEKSLTNQADVVETVIRSDLILISPIVLGELMFGFRNGSRFKQNMSFIKTEK